MSLRAADIRTRVDQPLDLGPIACVQVDTESLGKGQVGGIATLLIPALDSSSDRACYYCHVEHLGHSPFMVHFVLESCKFFNGELLLSGNTVVVVGVLGDQCSLLQQISVFGEAFLISKVLDLGYEFMLGNPGKWVLDLGFEVCRQIGAMDCRRVMSALLRVGMGLIVRPCVRLVKDTSTS